MHQKFRKKEGCNSSCKYLVSKRRLQGENSPHWTHFVVGEIVPLQCRLLQSLIYTQGLFSGTFLVFFLATIPHLDNVTGDHKYSQLLANSPSVRVGIILTVCFLKKGPFDFSAFRGLFEGLRAPSQKPKCPFPSKPKYEKWHHLFATRKICAVLHEYPSRFVTLSKCGSRARRPKKTLVIPFITTSRTYIKKCACCVFSLTGIVRQPPCMGEPLGSPAVQTAQTAW